MKMSEQIGELAAALSLAQGAMRSAIKSTPNPFFKSKYADLDAIWDVCRAPLSKNGLAIVQTPSFADGRVIISTALVHKSGQWLMDSLSLRPMKDDAQGVGACITYGRRQGMCIVGITSDEDDDGNQAAGKGNSTPNEASPLDDTAIFVNHPIQSNFIIKEAKRLEWTKDIALDFIKKALSAKLTMRAVAIAMNQSDKGDPNGG